MRVVEGEGIRDIWPLKFGLDWRFFWEFWNLGLGFCGVRC